MSAAQIVDLSAALVATFSPDANTRQAAEQHLAQLKETNFPSYLASVTNELGNEERPDDVRQAAGLAIKNAVDAKDAARRNDLMNKWMAVEPQLKQHIRDVLLRCLHSPKADVRKTTALVIAKIAGIDIQATEWPNLIPALLGNMHAQPAVSGTRQSTLMTLGYICEEVDESLLASEHVNMILTAIVAGMGAQESDEARLAAIHALTNAIHLAKNNFDVEQERTYLMQVVCQCTQASSQPMRVAAFQCLQQIADNYYSKLQAYMTELYGLTTKAIKDDQDEVATQAIEFWSTVAEYELDLLDDGKDSECKGFIASAAEYLLPILLQSLTKQDEDSADDEGSWTVSMASGYCLKLLARVCKDRLVQQVGGEQGEVVGSGRPGRSWHCIGVHDCFALSCMRSCVYTPHVGRTRSSSSNFPAGPWAGGPQRWHDLRRDCAFPRCLAQSRAETELRRAACPLHNSPPLCRCCPSSPPTSRATGRPRTGTSARRLPLPSAPSWRAPACPPWTASCARACPSYSAG